jgi:hypothetical protein
MLPSFMVVANPTPSSLPLLRTLCVPCVKTHILPRPAVSLDLAAKSHRIRTSEKSAPNPIRMCSFKTQDLKPFRMCSSKKKGEGIPFHIRCVAAHTHERRQPLSIHGVTSQLLDTRGVGGTRRKSAESLRRCVVTSLLLCFIAQPRKVQRALTERFAVEQLKCMGY